MATGRRAFRKLHLPADLTVRAIFPSYLNAFSTVRRGSTEAEQRRKGRRARSCEKAGRIKGSSGDMGCKAMLWRYGIQCYAVKKQLTLTLLCAKLITIKTDEAEITVVVHSQRVRGGGSRVGRRLSNGPLRAWRKGNDRLSIP